jgi:hypothetical protein
MDLWILLEKMLCVEGLAVLLRARLGSLYVGIYIKHLDYNSDYPHSCTTRGRNQ